MAVMAVCIANFTTKNVCYLVKRHFTKSQSTFYSNSHWDKVRKVIKRLLSEDQNSLD